MTSIIRTERLTKAYGPHRGIVDVDLDVEQNEIFGFLGPNGAGKTTTIRTLLDLIRPTSGRAFVFEIETQRRSGGHPPSRRVHPRRVRALRPPHRRPDDPVLRQPARQRRPGVPGAPDRAPRHRPQPQVQGALEGQQAEDRARHRAPAPAGPADPRRADVRPRPPRPADLLRDRPRGEGRGPLRLPLEPHPVRGRAHLRPRRDHPRRPARQGRPRRGPPRPRPPPGRAALRGHGARRRVRGPARASATSASRTTRSASASAARSRRSSRRPPATSCSTSSAASPASRRRSSPSTAASPPTAPRSRGGGVMSAASPTATFVPPKTRAVEPDLRPRDRLRQDAPRLAARDHHRRRHARRPAALERRRRSARPTTTAESRKELAEPRRQPAARAVGRVRQPVPRQHRDPGRLDRLEVRRVDGAHRRAVVRLRDVRRRSPREARRGSLEFVATTPLGMRRIAVEKLAAHLTGMAIVVLVTAIVRVGRRIRVRHAPRRRDLAAVGVRLRALDRRSSRWPPAGSPSRWPRSSAAARAAGDRGRDHARRLLRQRLPGGGAGVQRHREPHLVGLDGPPPAARGPVRLGDARSPSRSSRSSSSSPASSCSPVATSA